MTTNVKEITKEYLVEIGACEAAVSFLTRNELLPMPVDKLNLINGDYQGYKAWMLEYLETGTASMSGPEDDLRHEDDTENTYGTDPMGRVISRTSNTTPSVITEWGYDAVGNVNYIKHPDGTETGREFRYDDENCQLSIYENGGQICHIPD